MRWTLAPVLAVDARRTLQVELVRTEWMRLQWQGGVACGRCGLGGRPDRVWRSHGRDVQADVLIDAVGRL